MSGRIEMGICASPLMRESGVSRPPSKLPGGGGRLPPQAVRNVKAQTYGDLTVIDTLIGPRTMGGSMFKLVISDDEGTTTVVPLARDEITIGRKEGNTIRLTERNVSRAHAKLRRANGAFLVEDLGSENGISLNGERISSQGHLKHGDEIHIGDYTLILQDDAIAAADASRLEAGGLEATPPMGSQQLPVTVPVSGPAAAAVVQASIAEAAKAKVVEAAPDPARRMAMPTLTGTPPLETPGNGARTQFSKPPPVPSAQPKARTDVGGAVVQPRLVMLSLPNPGAEYPLSRERTRFGRSEDLEVFVGHRSISREHAELTRGAEGFVITDLGSQNGVRVNGKDLRRAVLSSGDLLELGQVRFRFVGAGEAYSFDADKTTVATRRESSSRTAWAAAIMIIGGALTIAGAVVFWPGRTAETASTANNATTIVTSSDQTPRPYVANPPAENVAARIVPIDPTEARVQTLKAQCDSALVVMDAAAAHRAAQEILRTVPRSNTAAQALGRQCAADAETLKSDLALLDRMQRRVRVGDINTANRILASLAPESRVRATPAYQEVSAALAAATTETTAQVVASTGLPTGNAPSSTGTRTTSGAPRVPSASSGSSNPPRNPRGTDNTGRDPRATTAGRNPTAQGSGSTQAGSPQPVPTSNPSANTAQAGATNTTADNGEASLSPADALRQARGCILRRPPDQQCVLRLLEGRATTATALGMVIEAHLQIGQERQALEKMRRYVDRYPSEVGAERYRRVLGALTP